MNAYLSSKSAYLLSRLFNFLSVISICETRVPFSVISTDFSSASNRHESSKLFDFCFKTSSLT
ncbi:hypothetical protein HanXRQr2_Chr11g0495781 [Helianthus annuus]|uniref:Uncharacterized protein n=1 Tax=Helianthus annuus TaxID=4232 RepID=A0A9K3HQQ2_HELAN|nr:hypothetical protein HanXRQr2_Chr11g0495781 [Helianthus annuus]KAJ0875556.1 hypothetical protein HanPSC8_Chr11g0477801 [Helianthus annuus]